MNNITKTFATSLVACLFSTAASASLIGVSGGASNLGGSAQIISAPGDIGDDTTTNIAQQGFDEIQDYLLTADLNVDGGSIASGTEVDSHMIFLNTENNLLGEHIAVEWTFSGTILGVMADYQGLLESSSNSFLGAPGTNYPGGFAARGLEGDLSNCNMNFNDCYSVSGNTLTLTMRVSEPGDWIRVITTAEAQVPEPATLLIFSAGLIGLGFMRKSHQNENKEATLAA